MIDITLTSRIPASARTIQISGMFDYHPEGEQTLTWHHTLPLDQQPWSVGMIVGPSGSGKSVLARHLWGERVRDEWEWEDRPMIEDFPKSRTISEIAAALNSVGFGTVPAWLRPYKVLSNGEKFRANMARSLLGDDDPIVVDEFTSVVDRQVAKIASHATQKAVRRAGKRFVAVTCHYDVEEWLQPDWIYDVAAGQFRWRLVQPHPPIELAIHPVSRSIWPLFEPHHYMSGNLMASAKCFAAYIDDRPVAFTSYRHFMHWKVRDIKMGHRLVVLPDYQGIGIANHLSIWLGEYLRARGFRYHNTVAHPAMIRLYSRSPRWRPVGSEKKVTPGRNAGRGMTGESRAAILKRETDTRQLACKSFAYVPLPKEEAYAYLHCREDS